MAAATGVESEATREIVEYLRKTPKAAGVLFASFISGHLWVFIFIAYFRKSTKADALIKSAVGRTVVGLFWLILVLVPYYILKYKQLPDNYDLILDSALPTIIFGMFLQLIIVMVVVTVRRR